MIPAPVRASVSADVVAGAHAQCRALLVMGHWKWGIRYGNPFWFKTIADPYETWLLQQAGWKGKALVLTRDNYTAEPEDLEDRRRWQYSPDG